MADRTRRTLALSALGICVLLSLSGALAGQEQTRSDDPLSKWRSGEYPGIRYVGSALCAECHRSRAGTQSATPMAHAIELPDACRIFQAHERLTFHNGPYSYLIVRDGNQWTYTISEGAKSISEAVLYCFGEGKVGQTYVFKHNGLFYESRVSYYAELQNLEITTGHPHEVPTSLEEAVGRPMTKDEVKSCFGCHAPSAVNAAGLQLDRLIPGVTCESCHGPGEKHIAAVKAGLKPQIFNPGKLDANDLSQEFCGSCHRSFETVMLMPKQDGINNVRFQPYRMFNSRGHNQGDPRMSCVACHNPHEKLERNAEYYDSKCLTCHLSTAKEARSDSRSAPACPVNTKQCVTCHMPKVEVPEMHFKFTDHWIRVAKPNAPVPR
jgi:hypothetical protein